MAVKASATVTLSCYRDTQSITRYYKLQSSTASAPSKPTTNPPPSGWTDAEPSYTSGSTNTLYFCDLSVFSDGTWSYSTVSKSSAYEAAKEAYNKAVNAQNSVNEVQIEVDEVKERVTNAETKITQNESAISLRATKEEVESNGNRIALTESEIRQLADMIATLVTDENGASLMTQTASGGWTFSMGAISDKLAKTQEDIRSLIGNMDAASSDLDTLKSALNDIGILADYVIITTYNGQPCIELGEAENAFKLRITNTEIQFAEGTTIPAYITNKKLMINSAVVKEELQFGGFVWKVRSNGNLGLIWKGVDG